MDWASGKHRPVEVNQRALIDKVLARYSGEFTLFRELLQNADDAASSVVEIYFRTRRGSEKTTTNVPLTLTTLESGDIVQWTFRNNGKPFQEEDWKRLPKIAEGNPNPEKIGAFGVGFYSLFSVTDCPSVSSAGYGMHFSWKDEDPQLYVRGGPLPAKEAASQWTTFEMPLRKPSPLPPPLDLMRFLASSITFMVYLKDVGIFLDNHLIGRIRKSAGGAQTIDFPIDLKLSSPLNVMKMTEIQCQPIEIESQAIRAIYAGKLATSTKAGIPESHQHGSRHHSSEQMSRQLQLHGTRVDLMIFTAKVNVTPDKELSKELHRWTKKAVPSRLQYSMIYTGKAEYDRSLGDQENQEIEGQSVFQGLYADLDGALQTRIFIGHSTGQTTGVGGHMASYFIPTVERESIDLVDRHVSVWNRELLYIGGLLCRAVYEWELSNIQNIWDTAVKSIGSPGPNSRPSAEAHDQLDQDFIHLLKFFAFHPSTPSPKVSELLQISFHGCSTSAPRLFSSAGVHRASDVKGFDPVFVKFVDLPMLSQAVTREDARIIATLPQAHKISAVSIPDVIQDLQKHTLNEEQLVACLTWWLTTNQDDPCKLLHAASYRVASGLTVQLSSMTHFIDPKGSGALIPPNASLPTSLVPLHITKHFTSGVLLRLRWQEFTIIDWLGHISNPAFMSVNPTQDFTKSKEWAECVLRALSRAWVSLSNDTRHSVKAVLMARKCIPTSHGLYFPEQSYFPGTADTTLFQDLDLPIVPFRITTGLESREMHVLLLYIGVRQYIHPDLLLNRIVESDDRNRRSNVDLINYLVQNPLTPDDFSKFQSSSAFTSEDVHHFVDNVRRPRYPASELYPPTDIFRQLQLPVIDWSMQWQDGSREVQLLYRLGLRRYPPLDFIVGLCASQDLLLRKTAFVYLCGNLRSAYSDYDRVNFRHVAFIPAERRGEARLCKVEEVFSGSQWKALDFSVVHVDYEALVSGLGIRQHPPTPMLIQAVEATPPHDEATARLWFETLSERISSFTQPELTRLAELPIVPTNSLHHAGTQMLPPSQCYLSERGNDGFYSRLFVFVDFGSIANRFLSACGSKHEPSVKDVAESLIDNPERFRELAGSDDNFLAELRDIAARSIRLSNATLSKMRSRPILLGQRRRKTVSHDGSQYDSELRRAGEIVIVDDESTYQLFSDIVFAAPRDESLERFYASLGCSHLSHVVQERFDDSREIEDPKTCSEVQNLILDRLPLFLQKCTNAKPQIPLPFTADNFRVRVCERLLVSKTLVTANNEETRAQDVWATTNRGEQGRIDLWLSHDTQEDMYEVATALCWLLFGTAKFTDTLLLTTILSTDREVLKRRGFIVGDTSELRGRPDELLERDTTTRRLSSSSEPSSIRPPLPRSVTSLPASGTECLHPQTSTHHPLSKVRRVLRNLAPKRTPRDIIQPSYIRDNVEKAINACKLGGRTSIDYRRQDISRLLNNGYCETSRKIGDLHLLGELDGVKVYAAKGVAAIETFMTSKHEVVARFISILNTIVKVYQLANSSLCIFYDTEGGCIGFNRKGILFLNLRYYEEWHDEEVKNGVQDQALLSWFFTLAHEIAHNLTPSHDSEHEFWLSALCEAHMIKFSQLLRPDLS